MMMRLILVSGLILINQPGALAAEGGIGGISSDQTRFIFDVGAGALPASNNYYIPPVVSSAKPEAWQTESLRANLYRSNPNNDMDMIEGQCVFLSSGTLSFISCAKTPQNELSGVVYKSGGINKSGETRFVCIKNCSKRVPKKLQTFTVESGC
jgi:hypothetical protein